MPALVLAALLLALPSQAAAASLYLSPAQATPTVGQPLTLSLYADTGSLPADAAEAEISYDPAKYAIRDISTDGSVLVTWATPPAAEAGTLRLSGWARNRFSGRDALILRFELVPLVEGAGSLRIVSGTLLMADEQETNVVSELRGASFAVQQKATIPPIPIPVATTSSEEQAVPQEATSAPARVPEPPAGIPPQTSGAPAQPALAATAGDGFLVIVLIILGIALCGAALGYAWHRAGR